MFGWSVGALVVPRDLHQDAGRTAGPLGELRPRIQWVCFRGPLVWSPQFGLGCCSVDLRSRSIYLSIYICIYIYISVYLSICLFMCIPIYLSMCTHIYIHINVSTYIYIHIHIGICIGLGICLFFGMYVHVHVHVHHPGHVSAPAGRQWRFRRGGRTQANSCRPLSSASGTRTPKTARLFWWFQDRVASNYPST